MAKFARGFSTRRSTAPRRSLGPIPESIVAHQPELQLDRRTIYRFILGIDEPPASPLDSSEAAVLLCDPFAELLLKRNVFPLTTNELLTELNQHNADPLGLPVQKSFLVADGGKIAWTPATDSLNRFFRLAISRSRGSEYGILISSSVDLGSTQTEAFLQVIGWDPQNQVYNYYERRDGAWIWAGNSWHALRPESRGKGPFDSHVNGSLVMKELKFPWNHWHSQSSTIDEGALAPEDPLRHEPLFLDREGAEILQSAIVQPGIERWTDARFKKLLSAKEMDAQPLLVHCLDNTTVNLTSSDQRSALVSETTMLRLPLTFFLNVDALLNLLSIDADVRAVEVRGSDYLDALREFEIALRQGSYRFPGETLFAFLVPEYAYEDLAVVERLIRNQVITERFAACLLMVDFPNPVYSARRRALMQYVPRQTMRSGAHWDLESAFVTNVERSPDVSVAGSPEAEFLKYLAWDEATWRAESQSLIEAYYLKLKARAATRDGCFDFMRLGESRRRQFRKTPLAEFDLTLPTTNIDPNASPLFMNQDGTLTA